MDSSKNRICDIDSDGLKEPMKINKKLGDYIIVLSKIIGNQNVWKTAILSRYKYETTDDT